MLSDLQQQIPPIFFQSPHSNTVFLNSQTNFKLTLLHLLSLDIFHKINAGRFEQFFQGYFYFILKVWRHVYLPIIKVKIIFLWFWHITLFKKLAKMNAFQYYYLNLKLLIIQVYISDHAWGLSYQHFHFIGALNTVTKISKHFRFWLLPSVGIYFYRRTFI